ncbi:MAG TPA: ankyrin repeat domain-containing protein [Candidatus Acidoferrales bacterium]|nr:ankyrin repeat domain-containing protein [Candidatus Acidoferrales bacterium]
MRVIVTLVASLAFCQAGELHRAARRCDGDRMRQLLSHHPPLNETDENGMTPLNIAIDSRQTACVGLLLESGADPKARDQQGRTAFDVALNLPDLQDLRAIRLLLWNSDREKHREQMGPMPWSLEYTARRGQTNVTKMLLALGADPNATGTAGTTPLADAALKGDLDGVRVLLAHGARLNAISLAGTQPIHDAALGDCAEVIRELAMHGADMNARTRGDAQTPLHIAAAMGKMNAVEALVALGADLRVKDSNGRTPLEAAERADLANVVAFLRRAVAAK